MQLVDGEQRAGFADELAGATSSSASIPLQAAAQSGEHNVAHAHYEYDEQMAGDADRRRRQATPTGE